MIWGWGCRNALLSRPFVFIDRQDERAQGRVTFTQIDYANGDSHMGAAFLQQPCYWHHFAFVGDSSFGLSLVIWKVDNTDVSTTTSLYNHWITLRNSQVGY